MPQIDIIIRNRETAKEARVFTDSSALKGAKLAGFVSKVLKEMIRQAIDNVDEPLKYSGENKKLQPKK